MNYKKSLYTLVIICFLVASLAICENFYLENAHMTFENYYNFLGCTQLIERTDTYGTCKLANDKIEKIVLYDNRWFLDGDLPCGLLCF